MNDAETTRTPFDPAILFKALFLAVIAIFVLVPLLATLLGGFKSLGELRVNPFGLPRHWEWQNYADILFFICVTFAFTYKRWFMRDE